ncbi:hypothetical protein SDC9_198145 [bioreactor metagenome]|uniref:MaoC-like domain-containing protein n=1 Tax=bioreactor metagenome TaxID=1076179 RepID=A0A645IGT4_9ZZZZ
MNQYTFKMLKLGMTETFEVSITDKMMSQFMDITGDSNPLHTDPLYASGFEATNGKCAVYGLLSAAFLSTLAGMYLPGKYSIIHHIDTEFVKIVHVGDKLKVSGTVKEMDERFNTIILKVAIENQNGEKVCRGKMRIGVLK